MKKIYLLTIIYVIGLFLLLLTGLCEANWVFYIALCLSIVVCVIKRFDIKMDKD